MENARYKRKTDFTPDGKVQESYSKTGHADQKNDLKVLVLYQVKRYITKLYKNHLTQLEDIQQEQLASVDKVRDLVTDDFIKMLDVMDAQKHGYYRKKTLDAGNETVREIEALLENFEFKLKK